MSELETFTVEVDHHRCRVWKKGTGPRVGFLAGFGGLPRWIPFLDELATRHEVIVPSLPGFPGGGGSHRTLDTHLDWLLVTRDLLRAAGLDGADLVGSSVGGGLLADVAALWPTSVRRLALIAPFGVFLPGGRQVDPWAQRPDTLPSVLCADPALFVALRRPPEDADPVDWAVEQVRAVEASARIYFPLGDTRLARRLPRITAPTLLLWGDADRVLPLAYADAFAAHIRAGKELRVIEGAGHLAELDRPTETAQAVSAWLGPHA